MVAALKWALSWLYAFGLLACVGLVVVGLGFGGAEALLWWLDSSEAETKVAAAPPPSEVPTPTATAAGANPAHDLLQQADPAEQLHVMGIIVRSVGYACEASGLIHLGPVAADNSHLYTVNCTSGESYVVTVYADEEGSSKVLDCKFYKLLAGDACPQKPFEE